MDVLTKKTQTLLGVHQDTSCGPLYDSQHKSPNSYIAMYDTFTATITQLLQVTITNSLDLENQLFQLYMEVHALVYSYLPDEEEDDDMPPLEDITDNES